MQLKQFAEISVATRVELRDASHSSRTATFTPSTLEMRAEFPASTREESNFPLHLKWRPVSPIETPENNAVPDVSYKDAEDPSTREMA